MVKLTKEQRKIVIKKYWKISAIVLAALSIPNWVPLLSDPNPSSMGELFGFGMFVVLFSYGLAWLVYGMIYLFRNIHSNKKGRPKN